jgi:hypothetical protein
MPVFFSCFALSVIDSQNKFLNDMNLSILEIYIVLYTTKIALSIHMFLHFDEEIKVISCFTVSVDFGMNPISLRKH